MKYVVSISLFIWLFSCKSIHNTSGNNSKIRLVERKGTFNYITLKDSFDIQIISFVKNDAYCFTEGIPYGLIIGTPVNTGLPDTISILARCDNNAYKIGEKIRVLPIENPETGSLHKITFTKDTIIAGRKFSWQIGSEHKAVWGQVLKRY